MNWENVNLKDGYERDQNIIDPLSFDTLLLEISCNLKGINEATIRKQFEEDLNSRIQCAKDVFGANLQNILNQATEERNEN